MLDYQIKMRRTVNTNLTKKDQIINAAMGLVGESAETSERVKKIFFQGHMFDSDGIIEELGDVCWYLFLMCNLLGVEFEEVLEKNLQKLYKRYPEKFTVENSEDRDG